MKVRFLCAALAIASLTGCGSISGFSNARSDFGCADAQGKPSCKSISEVYSDGTRPSVVPASSGTVKPVFEGGETGAKKTPPSADFVTLSPAQPWRKPETVLRVWLAPFTDVTGDLHDQRYMYVRLNNGGWETDVIESLADANRPERPIQKLTEDKETTAEEVKREKLKQLPSFGSKTLPLS